jgi:hypothetical protein
MWVNSLRQASAELEICEQAADALAAKAGRIKSEFERRAVGLETLEAFAREQTGS